MSVLRSVLQIERIQAAQPDDYDAMLALFADAFDDAASYLGQPPDLAYRQKLLNKDDFIALVAKSDQEVIGALAAYELVKFEQARSEIYLYDLAVDERWRRQGVATALITRLQAIAAERGAWVIFVQADTGAEDAAANALYAKLGQAETVRHYDIAVASA